MGYIGYSLVTLILWGLWGFGSKLVAEHFSPVSAALWPSLAATLSILSYGVASQSLEWNRYGFLALGIGVISAMAIITFYRALKLGPVSVVIPLTSLYLVIPVILGIVFLNESITPSKAVGVVMAALAIWLLCH